MSKSFIPLSVPNFSGREQEYVQQAVVSEWVSTGGSKVGEFEQALASYVDMPNAVACASGTAGLHLAMLVAGIGEGDEVLAPALTFIAAVNPVRYVGAQPVFIGCDDTLCIDPAQLEEFCAKHCRMKDGVLINKKSKRAVRAVMVVHVFGNMAYMQQICEVAKRYNLTVIEDATEALGSYETSGPYKGRMAGSIGDVGVYSFNGNKIITTGAGGMLVANKDGWAQRAKHLSTQAKTDEIAYLHDEVGYNYRMTNLQAALGLAQLEQLEGFIERKCSAHALYVKRLHGVAGLRILPFRQDVRSNRWFFSLYITEDYPLSRDELLRFLQSEGIQTRPIWGLIHEQKPYEACEAYGMEKAQDYYKKVLNIPCSTGITDEEIERVCAAVLSGAQQGGQGV